MPNDTGVASSSLPSSLTGLAGSGRQAFLQSLSQHARLITIETPLPAAALLVERFTGREAMSELFRFEVDCVSTSAHFELKALSNREVTLRLLLANGSSRAFHGVVISAQQLGSDGSLARYRLVLAPWMHRLTQRRDNYVFQDKSVLDIIDEVLQDYPFASYRFDVKTLLPKRSMTMQYRESDFDFIARLLAEEGLNFHFTHGDDHGSSEAAPSRTTAAQTESKAGQARHQLVIFDDNEFLAAGADPEIRFNRAAATESADTITLFAQRRQVQSNAVFLANWDYKKLTATAAEDNATESPAHVPVLEVYEGAGAYRYADEAESSRIAQVRAQSLQFAQQVHHAESSVRALAVGTWFALTGADGEAMSGNDEFAVLSIEHSGANNLFPGVADLARTAGAEAGTYRNRFTCVPRSVPVRPSYWKPKPLAPGAQVALVVGVADEEITTERNHRVKVQFPWQRGDAAISGQGMHPATSNAPGNETAGTWVRVAEPAAGANWGGNFIPRIGQEVQIDFIGGDIDRPVVIGQVYNGNDAPPWHGGDNHPGALAGFKSKEVAGGGFSQWVMDDTPGQLRQSFATSHAASQMNTGYLIRQDGNVRGSYRGTGLELATDAWSTLRAKRGLFVTSSQRQQAVSTQMDTEEAKGKLKSAEELARALSDAAVQHQALALSTPQGMQQLTEAISGKDTFDDAEAPSFTKPVALLDSAAGMNVTTPASAVAFAGQDMTQTTHLSTHLTAGQAVSVVSGKTASLFTHAGGAKLIAGNSPMSVQAHTGPMDVLADQAMTITSSNGSIKIQAKQEILLTSGGGYIRLKGGNIDIHCPSSVSVKGASHDFNGAASNSAALSALPTGLVAFDPPEKSLFVKTLTEVAKIELQTASDDGSANDGTGSNTQKGLIFGKAYTFKATQYTNNAPNNLSEICWVLKYTSPEGSKNKEIEKILPLNGETIKLVIDDKDICGCNLTLTAYILDAKNGGSLKHFVHNRYRWFDAALVAQQISERLKENWRIDQAQTSLCGMAALYYVMLKKQPHVYEKLAKELLRTGEYQIENYTVKPNYFAAEKMYAVNPNDPVYKNLRMFEVDWLVLATSRSGESNVGYDGLEDGSSMKMLQAVNWPGILTRMAKEVAGYTSVDSTGLTLVGLPINKSLIGQLHDKVSESDLEELLEIDNKFKQGSQILLMVDSQVLKFSSTGSYSVTDTFTRSHWIVYEGGLVLSDASGNLTADLSKVQRVFFRAYTWGTDPHTADTHLYPNSGTLRPNIDMNDFIKRGISVNSWKSNYYGYIETH